MTRRSFFATAAGGALAMNMPAADNKNSILEMRTFKLRNTADNMVQRTTDFLSKTYVPALRRAGAGTITGFASVVAPDSPFITMITSYPSLTALDGALQKISADKEYLKDRDAFTGSGLPYVRMEASLLRCFDSIPNIETGPADDKKTHLFEMRTYESNSSSSLEKKIRMFNEGEIAIFRKLNMRPVFFGQTLFGRNMPNLT